MIDPRGRPELGVGSGMNREIYSSFWLEVSNCYLLGKHERVPVVRHDLFKEEWKAMGQIVVKGSKDTEYFPTILSKAFVHYCLYNDVSEVQFIDSFKRFLSVDEAEIVQKALDAACETDPVFACHEFMDFLDQFKCRCYNQ